MLNDAQTHKIMDRTEPGRGLVSKHRYAVACLAGDGIGPELMAEASRALAAVSRLHGFAVEEWHVPFGGDAVRRFGRPFPAATREAVHAADAVLVVATKEPALEDVKAELDLTWRVQRVLGQGTDLTVFSPLGEEADAWTIERAFQVARTRRAHVASVGAGGRWRALFREAADRHAGVLVEELALEDALPLLAHAPDRVDVVVTEGALAEALSAMAALAEEGSRVVASGRLSRQGPGIFGPTHGSAPDIAGQGVANPSGILLAAALMLAEGLGERAAATTLEGAVAGTLESGARTPDLVGAGTGSTTREFMDVLLAELPGARTDTEFYAEVK
jgi:3-isopropylmalate dehydrogenase